jgi:Glucanosyltransferase
VVYAITIDTRQDHSYCMKLFEDAGIGLFIQLNLQGPNLPAANYNGDRYIYLDYNVMDYFTAVIDEFQMYPNTLGFFHIGEDIYKPGMQSITWKKMTIRENKKHMAKKGYRPIPIGVGLTHHDVSQLASFLNCGDRNSSMDFVFFDFNFKQDDSCPDPKSWASTDMINQYRTYDIPAFYLYGCNKALRGNFDEVKTIYRNESLAVFSGGVAFEYFETWQVGADHGMYI